MSRNWLVGPRMGIMSSLILLGSALLAMGSAPYIPPEMEEARKLAALAADKELITLALWVAILSIGCVGILVRMILAQSAKATQAAADTAAALREMAGAHQALRMELERRPCVMPREQR